MAGESPKCTIFHAELLPAFKYQLDHIRLSKLSHKNYAWNQFGIGNFCTALWGVPNVMLARGSYKGVSIGSMN